MISTPIALFAVLLLVGLGGIALYVAIIAFMGGKSNTKRIDVLEDSHEELKLSNEQMQAVLDDITRK